MRKHVMKKGSALLIVLGMLSFMVISAVSFAIYMRQSRQPSSYLRRNVAARYLVRAALAKAIDQLEGDVWSTEEIGKTSPNGSNNKNTSTTYFFGVYDDPYPGVGVQSGLSLSGATNYKTDGEMMFTQNGDFWYKRVFMPFGPVDKDYYENKSVKNDEDLLGDTVATIPLEGLAYLPPAIANDVRLASRMTRTAQWHSLPYDSGRYAYTAVNVSDLFDINKLSASVPRDSSSAGRISLGSLCLDDLGDPTSVSDSKAKAIDSIRDAANEIPFVSMADFTLLAGTTYGPFLKYINQSGSQFMGDGDEAGNALFITDTWFPTTNTTTTALKLLDLEGAGQPFTKSELDNNTSYSDFSKGGFSLKGGQILEKNLGVGMICLADYLDKDSVPKSLALPTIEATPMIVGVGAPEAMQPEVSSGSAISKTYGTKDVPITLQNGSLAIVNRTLTPYSLKSFGSRVQISAVATYPFKRMAMTSRTKSFTYRAVMKIFLAPSTLTACRFSHNDLQGSNWKNLWTSGSTTPSVADGVVTVMGTVSSAPSFSSDMTKSADIAKDFKLKFELENIDAPLFTKIEQTYTPVPSEDPDAPPPVMPDPVSFYSFEGLGDKSAMILRPMEANGKIKTLADFCGSPNRQEDVVPENNTSPESDIATLKTASTTHPVPSGFSFCVAVWIQVLDGSQVVDMVPAYCNDDAVFLDYDGAGEEDAKLGEQMPLVYFKVPGAVNYDDQLPTTFAGTPVTFTDWKSLYAVDPRYNFAPEDWFTVSDKDDVNASDWFDRVKSIFGTKVQGYLRDRDPFFFVSDQEYLQSIGELQFLPAIQEMNGSANVLRGDYSPTYNGAGFASRTSATGKDFANVTYFWRTYTAYNMGDGTDPIYEPMQGSGGTYQFVSGPNGFHANPYSQDERVMWAALANAPFDYYVASTNKPSTRKLQLVCDGSLSDASDWTFGPDSKDKNAQWTKNNLLDFSDTLRDKFIDHAKTGSTNWEDAFDSLAWQAVGSGDVLDENKTIWGDIVLDNPLHGVDRKFLYSFWRECFANRQQLYLIFVRAEPASVGGGGSGKNLTSQMGGRAVALVWRDPEPPSYNSNQRQSRTALNARSACRQNFETCPPHRTRILFYHVFD